jgi:NtrC-family two-component system response regulator AlgB
MDSPAPSLLRVLVVDDEPNIRDTLALCIQGSGCRVEKAASGAAALEALRLAPYDLAFCDLRLGSESGLDLLPRLLAERPGLDVVVITAFATIETAVEAMRRGARDYLQKPFAPSQIRHQVDAARARRSAALRIGDLEARLAEAAPEARLETASPRMRAALETLTRAAGHDVAVLLRGESGTGKGVLARALHAASPRRDRPFVTVNCPTLSEELLASELFGHARGAFTGAVRDQEGRVEAAEGGTVFLDEVGEISPSLQAKLLRFLQEKRFERVGESRTRTADVRVVAATNRDLEKAVASGAFREDLLYRLNAFEVTVPPLRERPEDVLPLAEGFAAFFARQARCPPPELTEPTRRTLLAWPWPGNLRELRNAVERAVILSPGPALGRRASRSAWRERGRQPARRRSAATAPSRRSSASTSCGCSPGRRPRRRRRGSWGSTPRRSGASGRGTGGRSRLRRRRLARQPEPEGAALPRLALHAQLAAVGADDLARDVEPEAHAAAFRPRHLEEALEDALLILARNALAVVVDLEAGALSLGRHARRHPTAGGAVAHGVADEVGEDDPDALGVGDRRYRLVGLLAGDLHAGCRGRGAGLGDRLGEQPAAVERPGVQLHAARLDAGEVEDVVHDPLEPFAVLARRRHEIGLALGERSRRLLDQHVHRQAEGGERRPELVGHGGRGRSSARRSAPAASRPGAPW